ncbi:hypothetical protein GIB67_020872, partial [Kingdonia uniflora]
NSSSLPTLPTLGLSQGIVGIVEFCDGNEMGLLFMLASDTQSKFENIKAYLSYAKKPTGQRVSRPSFEDDG